ncbi:hypothetical protein [Rhodococcus ruber]|uniref:hypothetical protein n=1 Tax=Rhodococcus ruber TaxID=1830 RepID=UPI00265D6567|nr:hypothetical protein [Rhodococcus ruber]MDO1477266.1 hypothetical protein [Rhodococcus ruber]
MTGPTSVDPYVYLCPQCRLTVSGQVWEDVLRQGRAHDSLHAHYDPRYRGIPTDPATLAELPPILLEDGAA